MPLVRADVQRSYYYVDRLSGNVVLITGGATGIGLAMADAFLKGGSEVIICGRGEARLRTAKKKHPELPPRACPAVMKGLGDDVLEVGYGTTEGIPKASRAEIDRAFQRMNSRW